MADVTIWILLAAGYLLTWLLIPWVLMKRTVHASAAVAWIFAIIFLPYLGALLCGIFGTTRWERRSQRKRAASAHINEGVPQQTDAFIVPDDALHPWSSVARLVAGLTGTPVLTGNRVELLPDTHHSFELLQEMIETAQHWSHIEFYIWRHDDAGTQMRDLLIRKARAGVQVRFLYDGIGSMQLSRAFLRPLKEAGVRVAPFTPGFRLWHVLTLNLRNHRKIVVTDEQVAFTGGMNIGREYIHPTESYGQLRDTQLLLRGPAVLQVQQVFAQDWFYATGEALTAADFYPEPRHQGDVLAQVVADGPDNRVDTFYMLALTALGQARERVTLTTPYFVPPDGLAVALATAARRGVRVRVMIARRGNFIPTLWAGRSYYEPLLAAGVRIDEYEAGLFHAKTLTVDGQWSLVGTLNWDFRSLILNFELAVSLFDPHLAEALEQHFEQDQQCAQRIEPGQWQQRSKLSIVQEQLWRLFAPTL